MIPFGIISSQQEYNPNIMAGFSPIEVTTDAIKLEQGVWQGYESCPADPIRMMPVNGEIGFRLLTFRGNWDQNFNIGDNTTGFLGVASTPTRIYWFADSPGGGNMNWLNTGVSPTANNWLVLKRNAADNLQILRSIDGINFTIVAQRKISDYLIGFNSVNNIKVNGYIDGFMYYPQGKNLI